MSVLRIPLLLALVVGCAAASTATPTESTPLPDSCFPVYETDVGGQIVGGVPTKTREFTFLVSLGSGTYSHCGGTLIGDKWVLTAAHCRGTWQVRVGMHGKDAWDRDDCIQTRDIVRWTNHPGYTRRSGSPYDAAVLELSAPVDPRYRRATFPAVDTPAGLALTVAGWGARCKELTDECDAPNVPHKVSVPAVTNAECRRASGWNIDESMLCAGGGSKDSCQGDSGGPLFTIENGDVVLRGVVSFGFGDCATPGQYGVYARVATFRDWILDPQGWTTTTTTTTTGPPDPCSDVWDSDECKKRKRSGQCDREVVSENCAATCGTVSDTCLEPCWDFWETAVCERQQRKGKCDEADVSRMCALTCDEACPTTTTTTTTAMQCPGKLERTCAKLSENYEGKCVRKNARASKCRKWAKKFGKKKCVRKCGFAPLGSARAAFDAAGGSPDSEQGAQLLGAALVVALCGVVLVALLLATLLGRVLRRPREVAARPTRKLNLVEEGQCERKRLVA